MRAALRQGIEADERDETAAVEDLRDELRELRDRQRTPLEEGGYLFASVVAGTSPIAMLYLTGLVSTPLAFVGGLATGLASDWSVVDAARLGTWCAAHRVSGGQFGGCEAVASLRERV